MKKKSWYGSATSTCNPQHGLCKFNQEHQRGGSSSAGPQAAKKRSWKRYLTLLSKFQSKMKRKKQPETKATHGSRQKKPSRGLLEECSSLAHVIQRTTAGCAAAMVAVAAAATSSGAAGEADLPYVQLDQVTYRVKRESFGPVYLVT